MMPHLPHRLPRTDLSASAACNDLGGHLLMPAHFRCAPIARLHGATAPDGKQTKYQHLAGASQC
jgi:hypothetical protein